MLLASVWTGGQAPLTSVHCWKKVLDCLLENIGIERNMPHYWRTLPFKSHHALRDFQKPIYRFLLDLLHGLVTCKRSTYLMLKCSNTSIYMCWNFRRFFKLKMTNYDVIMVFTTCPWSLKKTDGNKIDIIYFSHFLFILLDESDNIVTLAKSF